MANHPKSPVMWIEDPATGCWIWQRATNGSGYGLIRRNGKTLSAHRYIYEQTFGPVDPSHVVDHVKELCSTTMCVNPAHMQAVTYGENARRCKMGKLKAEDIRDIRSSTNSSTELAKKYKVSRAHINMIRAGTRGVVEACDVPKT